MSEKPTYEELEQRVKELEKSVEQCRRSEKVLRESEYRYQTLLQNAPVGVWDALPDGSGGFINSKLMEISGLTPESAQGTGWASALHPNDKERIYEEWSNFVKGKAPYHSTYRFRQPNGEVRWVIGQASQVLDADGGVIGYIGTLTDITERKQAEEALQNEVAERQRLTSILETTSDLVSTAFPNAQITYMNQAGRKLVGWDVDKDVRGKKIQDAHPEWAVRIIEGQGIPAAIESGVWEGETALLGPDGREIPVSQVIMAHKSSEGELQYLSTIMRDITDLKKSEEQLRESETRYRTLFNSAGDGIAIIKDGVHIECNPKLEELFGCPMDQIIGQLPEKFSPLTQPDGRDSKEKALEKINKALQGGTQFFEWQHKRFDGTLYDAEVTLNCFEIGSEKYLQASSRDITERKQAEEKRKELESKLRQAQKMEAVGTLAGGIAHDFNNILSPIMVHSEMAMMELPPESPIQHSLKEIFKAGERARDLVKQILTFSRKEEGKRAEIRITLVLKEVLKMLRSSIPTTIDIQQNMEAKSDTVLADPTHIHQIILNLGTNAAHAMREKGGTLKVSLIQEDLDSEAAERYSDLNPGSYLKLTVSDNGHGIDSETIQKIFEPYFTTKGPGEGTGMGLALVHGIVKSNGGDITVESEPGKGATFNLYIPRIETDVSSVEERSVKLPSGTERILFVDDEKVAVDAIKPMLEILGYNVTARTSSIETLEAFRNNPQSFDLIITDQGMPNMTGKDLARELMSIRSDIPIILCTGFSEQIDENKAKGMGISAFLMKPIVMRDMANTIRQVLDKKQ